ncbi:MAG: hypothetical protein IT365_18730 [Candidatus Hydrogenedentes bacterium]|nr:hypothetical protein [Candidatus Hydrogenedentota bacterium]
MTNKQTRCRRCGKIFPPQEGKTLCVRCTEKYVEDATRVREAIEQHGLETHEDIAAFAGVTADQVQEILDDPESMKKRVVEERICSRCKERPAQARSEYCFSCRMDLNKAFGDAARVLASIIEREMHKKKPEEPRKDINLASAVQRKRGRTGSSRIDPTPRNRYSS